MHEVHIDKNAKGDQLGSRLYLKTVFDPPVKTQPLIGAGASTSRDPSEMSERSDAPALPDTLESSAELSKQSDLTALPYPHESSHLSDRSGTTAL